MALSQVHSLTERDPSDGWEPSGPEWFRQVSHFRKE
jgi:hypothetical protein